MRIRPALLADFIKRVVKIDRMVVATSVGSFLVDPISYLGDSLIRKGMYEREMVETLKRFLSPGSVFVDVGANEGFFTVLGGSLVSASGRVVAVEPQTRLREVLEHNLKLNAVSNVALYQVAVSNTEGTADLHLTPNINTGASALVRPTRYRVATQPVRTITLTQLLADAKVEQVDLMKMDIEGFEYEAILGSRELFRAGRIAALALELHPDAMRGRGIDPNEIVDFLQSCGYREDCSQGNTVFVRDKLTARIGCRGT
jgi:FkbM family methyltransferase